MNLRQAHERPEGMEEAAVMMVGLTAERALQGLEILDHQPRGEDRLLRLVAVLQYAKCGVKRWRV